jgi:hypothetical protein
MIQQPLWCLGLKGGIMGSWVDEYVLFWKDSRGGKDDEMWLRFYAPTPEEAVERAERIVADKQRDEVYAHPFLPTIVEVTLYRGFRKFYGQVTRRRYL